MEENQFIDALQLFSKERDEQKLRGLNDYNPLTTVLNYHDEVRLHSRMIGSLLKINGKHYQGTLFLKEFLKELNLQGFINLDKAIVEVEYKDIDLYITDGDKHIIIENKIWADDQPCQIIKYINIIVEDKDNGGQFKTFKENNTIDENLLRVVYLSPKGKDPDEHTIKDEYITFSGGEEKLRECSEKERTKEYVKNGLKNYRVKYQKIGYKREILNWLKKSQEEISNITNLNSAIQYYINAVEEVVGRYKSSIKQYKDLFLKKEMYKAFIDYGNKFKEGNEIYDGFAEARQILYNNYFDELLKPLIVNDDSIEFYKFDIENKKIILQYEEYFEIWIVSDKNRFKSLGIRPAWSTQEWQDNQPLRNILNKINNTLQKNSEIQKYIIGSNKGVPLSVENKFQEVTNESLFNNKKSLDLNEIQEHIKSIKKILES